MQSNNIITLSYKCVGIFILLFFCYSSLANSFYYRADGRSPDEIKRAKGINSRGYDEANDRPSTSQDISLYNHARGAVTGNTRYNDGYVSTTSSQTNAHFIGQQLLGGLPEYYIYVIAAAPNLLDVNAVLQRYSPHPSEREYAALGRIPLSQVVGWFTVRSGVLDREMTHNPAYRERYYRSLNIAPLESSYQLAGFPMDFDAWRLLPWSEYAPAGCGLVRRSEIVEGKYAEQCNAATDEISRNLFNKYNNKNLLLEAGLL